MSDLQGQSMTSGSGRKRATTRDCLAHDKPLVWERGGVDKPTMTGRWYCPDCQAALSVALDTVSGQR